jgi:hypothetical protein
MRGQFLVGRIQVGIVAAGFGHARLGVVGNDQCGHALVELEGADVCADPIGQLFVAGGFRVGVGTGTQDGDEQVAGLQRAALRVMDGDGASRPIDEHLFAGFVLLAQHHIQFVEPTVIQFAKAAVAVALRIGLLVLFPEQLQGHVAVPLLLVVDGAEVGRRSVGVHGARRRTAEEN